MDFRSNSSARLVLRVALLILVTGCGVVTGTKAPQPVGLGSSSAAAVVPSGLQLGYVWHSDTGNLYPVVGVSGSAHYGNGAFAADANVAAAAAIASGANSWVLALRKDGTLQEWEYPASTTVTLAARIAVDSSIDFSPSGMSAALVSPQTSTLVVVSGLPGSPKISMLSLPSGFSPGDIAVSDTSTVLVGVKRATDAAIDAAVLSTSGSYTALATLQGWGGAAFLPGASADSVVLADSGTAQLALVTKLSGASPAITALAGAGVLQKPTGIAVSSDGHWAYVADAGKPQIVRIGLTAAGSAPSAIPCACTPQQMIPLTSDGIFSIARGASGQPDWILDTRTSQPRAFFVPAIAPSTSGQLISSAARQTDRTAQ